MRTLLFFLLLGYNLIFLAKLVQCQSGSSTTTPATAITTSAPGSGPPAPNASPPAGGSSFNYSNYDLQVCHDNATGKTWTKDRLKEIDEALDKLYDSIDDKSVTHEKDCTFSIEFREVGGSSSEKELEVLFRKYEIQRAKYERGLWGYCAEQGAKDLIYNIQQLAQKIKNLGNVSICNQDEMLQCHADFKKCQCIVDRRLWKGIGLEFYDSNDEGDELYQNIQQCVFAIGSDCPFLSDNSSIMCHPESDCLYKDTKKSCIPRDGWGVPDTYTPGPNGSYRFSRFIANTYCQCYKYKGKSYGNVNEATTTHILFAIFACLAHFNW